MRHFLLPHGLASTAALLALVLTAAAPGTTRGDDPPDRPPGLEVLSEALDHELPTPLDVAPPQTDEGAVPLPTSPGTLRETPARKGGTSSTTASPRTQAMTGTAAAMTQPVELRALVLATDESDYGLAPWRSTLDRVGAAYDVHLADTPLTMETLVGADGTGRYNAILLTSSSLLLNQNGSWVSALDAAEWNTLWGYERDFGVRQATLYTSYGTWPEETCFRPISEGGVDEAGITANLTTIGAGVFDYLNPQSDIPVQLSWVYRNGLEPTCLDAEPVLVSGDAVLGAVNTTPDGREQLSLTFSQNEHLMQSHLLTYGLFRWASRGMHLGEQRHYLKLDIDDFFNTSDIMLEDLTIADEPFQMSGDEALLMRTQQDQLHSAHPLASEFRLTLAYNGESAQGRVPAPNCQGGDAETLVAASRCVRDDVEWINHTLTHPKLNSTDYRTTLNEIRANQRVATRLGISPPANVLKTGEYSGLGVYNPDPTDDVGPPTDFGLLASNPALIQAARTTGSKYLHGNMSFASHVPDCFNCTIRHPLDPWVEIVPDWPTNIAYFSSTPGQETAFYNYYYGPQGLFPYYSTDQTYEQVIEHESTAVLARIASGSMYTNTMHIANLHDYGGGNTLAFDWVKAVVAGYESLYAVPLLSPAWDDLAARASQRTSHFEIKDGVRAVYHPVTGTVTVSSPVAGTLQLSGIAAPGSTAYGSDTISAPTIQAGGTQQWPAVPLP